MRRFANALAAHRFGGEEILQVARGSDLDCAAMKQIVDKAEQLARFFRNHCMDGFVRVKEARPRHLCDLERQRCRAGPSIERVVAVPEMFPCTEVVGNHGTN